jgi:hypothetical protein
MPGLNMLVSDKTRNAIKDYSRKSGLKMHSIVEKALLAFLPTVAERNPAMTLAAIEENLSNDVYLAALWFERAEGAGLIYGNGHHAAQELAQHAVNMLRQREIKKSARKAK